MDAYVLHVIHVEMVGSLASVARNAFFHGNTVYVVMYADFPYRMEIATAAWNVKQHPAIVVGDVERLFANVVTFIHQVNVHALFAKHACSQNATAGNA